MMTLSQTENINISLAQPLMQEFPEGIRLSRFSFFSLREYPIHTHLHMEIIYVLEGSLSIKVGVSNYTISAGEFTIINPFELHGLYCTDEPNRVCLLEISPRFYDPCEEGTIFVSAYTLYHDAAKEDFPKIEEVLRKIFHLHLSAMVTEESPDGYLPVYSNAHNEEYEKILLRTLINYFELHFTAEYFLLSDHKENTLRDSSVQADRLKNILSYFYENFPQKIQLQDVADRTYVNRYHISHLVKSGIGFTFSELLQHIRIEKAEIYLLGTDLPISQIVFELGFSSYRYFNQHFKSLFHMTPNAYRQKYQKQTILHKEISLLAPIPRSVGESLLLRWGSLLSAASKDVKQQGNRTCFIDLKKSPIQSAEHGPSCETAGSNAAPYSRLNWPQSHILYDTPYMASLLLSQIAAAGPFLKKHPRFAAKDEGSSENAAPFNGKPGAVTQCGLRKASFHTLEFLKHFDTGECRTAPHYFLTWSGTSPSRILHLLFYYAALDIDEPLSQSFPTPEALTAYIEERIQPMEQLTFSLDLRNTAQEPQELQRPQGIAPCPAAMEQQLKLSLDPFVQWQRMGCPNSLDQETVRALNNSSQPDTYFFNPQDRLEITLKPFDVKYLRISFS
ncbi:AraC family transcriptional regulator [Anaerovorax odorimutans]|uniref:AraC family transcriptional regulator n=2 Tax=Anaerovorax odorimutans TaxID=109327 RepID=A0ABT1RIY6_9FIRM|nr:AraC family transcriptional regulator [Anaerovorax odorimutans]